MEENLFLEKAQQKPPEEITLKNLIISIGDGYRFLMSKWILIFFISLLGALLGLGYSLMKKTVYRSSVTFVLDDSNGSSGGLGQYGGLASMVGIDIGGSGGGIFQGDNIFELYKSRSMVEKTLLSTINYKQKPMLLIDSYIEMKELRNKWATNSQLKNISFNSNSDSFTRLQDSVITEVVNDINKNFLTVDKPDKKLSIIQVEVKSTDEVFSKEFNEKIVKNVNDFYVQTKTKKSMENVAVLQHQTDSVRNILNGAMSTSAAIIDATPNLNVTRQSLRVPVQKSQFNAEANKAILTEFVKNLELSKLNLRKETPLIQVIDKPVYPLQKIRFGKLKGLLLGGILFGFLTVMILLLKRIIAHVMK